MNEESATMRVLSSEIRECRWPKIFSEEDTTNLSVVRQWLVAIDKSQEATAKVLEIVSFAFKCVLRQVTDELLDSDKDLVITVSIGNKKPA